MCGPYDGPALDGKGLATPWVTVPEMTLRETPPKGPRAVGFHLQDTLETPPS